MKDITLTDADALADLRGTPRPDNPSVGAQPVPAGAQAGWESLHYPFTPSKDKFDALYLSLCDRSITIHEIARRCWKAGIALTTMAAIPEAKEKP